MRIDISLPPELITRLRKASIDKYGNMRSLSRLIEDFAVAGLNGGQKSDPEKIKAAREEWCVRHVKELGRPVCWECGPTWENDFVCKACGGGFHIAVPDARYCPACGGTDIVPLFSSPEIRSAPESTSDLIRQIDLKEYPNTTPLYKSIREENKRRRPR